MADVIVDARRPAAADRPPPAASERAQARRETLRLLVRRPAFIIGTSSSSAGSSAPSSASGSRRTTRSTTSPPATCRPARSIWMGTDRLGRDVLSRVMVGSRDVLIVAPLAALLGVVAGTFLGLVMGYYRGRVDDVLSRLVEAFLALPVILVALLTLVVLGLVADRRRLRRRDPVHADRRADGALGRPVRARARLRHRGQAARRVGPVHPVARDLPERPRADRRRDDRPVRLRDLHGRDAVVPRRRPPAAVARLGPDASARSTRT